MQRALDPLPLLRALQAGGIRHVVIGGFAVNAHGVIRPSKDLDIVPAPDAENLQRLARVLEDLHAVHVGIGDFEREEFPFDPTKAKDLAAGANFRLETDVGDLDILQWVAGIESDPAYDKLAEGSFELEVEDVVVVVCSLEHLRAMKLAAGRPRDLDDLAHLPEA